MLSIYEFHHKLSQWCWTWDIELTISINCLKVLEPSIFFDSIRVIILYLYFHWLKLRIRLLKKWTNAQKNLGNEDIFSRYSMQYMKSLNTYTYIMLYLTKFVDGKAMVIGMNSLMSYCVGDKNKQFHNLPSSYNFCRMFSERHLVEFYRKHRKWNMKALYCMKEQTKLLLRRNVRSIVRILTPSLWVVITIILTLTHDFIEKCLIDSL